MTPGEEAEADFFQAAEYMDHAVEELRQSGDESHLPRSLLTRAALHRLRGNPPGAAADLTEALEIAERGGMRLFACDAYLEFARLDLQQSDAEAARKRVALARQLVNETGYRRRGEGGGLVGGAVEAQRDAPLLASPLTQPPPSQGGGTR